MTVSHQPCLPFTEPLACAPFSRTSRAAADSLPEAVSGRQERLVLECLKRRGAWGATDAEIQAATGIPVTSEVARRNRLVIAGLARDSGRTRPTPSGRAAVVWVATEGRH